MFDLLTPFLLIEYKSPPLWTCKAGGECMFSFHGSVPRYETIPSPSHGAEHATRF